MNTGILKVKIDGKWVEIPAIAGKSAYEIAQENGYNGSLTDFFADMKGENKNE